MVATFTPKRLFQGAVGTAPPGGTHPYTVPANTVAQVRALQFVNTTTATIIVTVWVLPAGASADTAHIYIPGVQVLAGLDDPDDRLLILNAGDSLDWQASAAGLNILVFGAEETLL